MIENFQAKYQKHNEVFNELSERLMYIYTQNNKFYYEKLSTKSIPEDEYVENSGDKLKTLENVKAAFNFKFFIGRKFINKFFKENESFDRNFRK